MKMNISFKIFLEHKYYYYYYYNYYYSISEIHQIVNKIISCICIYIMIHIENSMRIETNTLNKIKEIIIVHCIASYQKHKFIRITLV